MANDDRDKYSKPTLYPAFPDRRNADGHIDETGSERYYANLEQINSDIAEANKKIDKAVKMSQDSANKLQAKVENQLEKLRGEVRSQVDDSKNRVVETLAVFAALFTFLSLDVQIFKTQTSPNKIIGLILISGGLITFFVIMLDAMIKHDDDAEKFWQTRFILFYILSIALVVAGYFTLKLG